MRYIRLIDIVVKACHKYTIMSIVYLVSKTSAVNVVFPYFVADDPICRIEEFGGFDSVAAGGF